MSKVVLTVGPGHSLREAAKQMSERGVGAAVVMDPDGEGPGIITERDILYSLGHDQDVDGEQVCEHLTSDVVYAAPDWSLEKAAAQMVRGGFRHLIGIDQGEVSGVLSVRAIIRCWSRDGATSVVAEQPGRG